MWLGSANYRPKVDLHESNWALMVSKRWAVLARHAVGVEEATVLYSCDLITTALRSFDGILELRREPKMKLSWKLRRNQSVSAEPYSSGTPVHSPGVKQEFEWPRMDWDGTVIDRL